jgi:lambda repressor-like predicted transcriptional regulator
VNRTRWLAGAAAALAVVLGGGAAFAATGSSNSAADFVGDVAKRLGISEDKLEGAIEDATIARIDAAVAAGEITEEEGEELKERVRSGDVPAILPGFGGPRFGPPGPPDGFGSGRLALPDPLDTAADYLEMDDADMRRALRDGKSLADLARDKGKSVDGLKEALRDAIREDADKAVDDGVLTEEQADDFVEKLSGTVDELVDKGGGLGFGPRRPGFGIGPLGPPHKGILPGGLPGGDLMETAADYLGMDWADIHKALRDGRSLADLAKDQGKSVDGLEEALRDALRKDADRAVADGVLTQEQADRLVERLGGVVDKFVEGNLTDGFDFDSHGGGGSFEFHFRIGPEDRMPVPEGRRRPSFESPIVSPRPI